VFLCVKVEMHLYCSLIVSEDMDQDSAMYDECIVIVVLLLRFLF